MLDANITLVGNLVESPELRVTTTGTYRCVFRLASTPRRYDRAESRWVDGPTLFLRVICWRQLAENVAASLGRGDRAIVAGRMRQHTFESAQGERRRVYEIEADAVGLELTWHGARAQRTERSGPAPETAAAGEREADPPSPDLTPDHGSTAPDGAGDDPFADDLDVESTEDADLTADTAIGR
jgi:single-strand DNA-binding protein